MSSDEVIELPPIDVSHLQLSNQLFYTKNFYILVMIHITFLLTSIFVTLLTTFLYIRFKSNRNLYSRSFLCLMISEMLNSAVKLISILKLSDVNYRVGDQLCMMQGYFVSSTELTTLLIFICIIHSTWKLMLKQNSNAFLKIIKISISLFIFACLANLSFIFLDGFGSNDQSTSLYCEFNTTNSMGRGIEIASQSIFGLSIFICSILSIRLKRFFKKQAQKMNEPRMINKFEEVVKKMMYLNICYFIWFIFEVIVKQVLRNVFSIIEFPVLNFVVITLYLVMNNSRGTLLFLFCLDEEFKKSLTNMIIDPNKKKKSLNKNNLQEQLQNSSSIN